MYQVNLLSRNEQGSLIGAPNWIKNNSPFSETYNGNVSFSSLGGSVHSRQTISDHSSHVTDQWTPDSSYEIPRRVSPRIRRQARAYSQITPGTPGRTSSPILGGGNTPAGIKQHKLKLVPQFQPTLLEAGPPLRTQRHKLVQDAWNAIRQRRQSMIDLEKNPRYHPNYYNSERRVQGRPKIGGTPDNVYNAKKGKKIWANAPPNSYARSYDYFGNKYEITNDDVMNRHVVYIRNNMGPIERPVDFQTPPRTPRSPKVTWSDGDSVIPEWKTPVSETDRLLSDIKTPESFDSRGYNNILASPMLTTSQLRRNAIQEQVDRMPSRTRYGLYEEESILTTPNSVSTYGTPQRYYGYSPSVDTNYRHYPASIAAHVRDNRPDIAQIREENYVDVTANLLGEFEQVRNDANPFGREQRFY